MPAFGDRLSAKAAKELERLGVEIHTRSIVTDVDRHGVEVKGGDGEVQRDRGADQGLGGRGPGLPAGEDARRASPAPSATERGAIAVLPDCTLPGHPEVFAIGDMMSLDHLPGVAEVAMQQGIHAAKTIKRRLEGEDESKPFRYRDLGQHGDDLALPGRRELQGDPCRRVRRAG